MSLTHKSLGGAVTGPSSCSGSLCPHPGEGVWRQPDSGGPPPWPAGSRNLPDRRSGPLAFLPGAFPGGDGPPAAPGTHLVTQCLFGGPRGPMPIASKWVAGPPCCWLRSDSDDSGGVGGAA